VGSWGWGLLALLVALAPASAQDTNTPLYYQHPDGKPDYSPVPKKTPDGRDYVAVFEDQGAAAAATPPAGTMTTARKPQCAA